MASVEMQAYKISEIEFKNKVQGKEQLSFSNKVSYNVKYSQKSFCEGAMTVEVFDKDKPDTISIKFTLNGAFKILKDVEKEFIHVETFRELYAFAKAITATVTGGCGVPPIILQSIDIENQEIYRYLKLLP